MQYFESAGLVWFGQGKLNDIQYLQTWRDVPLTYTTDMELEHGWNVDHYDIILGRDETGQLFQRAAQLALGNQFYPPEVMATLSDFGLEKRPAQTGDLIMQRIHIFQISGKPILEVRTINRVTNVVHEPRRAGFTYATTLAHNEIGEWTPIIEWRDNNDVALVISVISQLKPGTGELFRRFVRRLQLRAHRLSIQNFVSLVNGGPRVLRPTSFSTEILPFGMLAGAVLVLAGTVFFLRRGSRK